MTRASTVAAAKLAEAAPVFAALGDDTRLHIVARLCGDGPLSIVQIADTAAVSRQAVTKHLRALQRAGLVRSDRAGRERIWELQPGKLAAVRDYLDAISAQWDQALRRMQALVEEPQ